MLTSPPSEAFDSYNGIRSYPRQDPMAIEIKRCFF